MPLNSNPDLHCCACGEVMVARIRPWSFRCPSGHAWASALDVTINEGPSAIDEAFREHGLETIRHENNSRVLKTIDALFPLAGARLLDVGSAHGWFIEAAADCGATVTGIEPDAAIAQLSRLPTSVRQGFFPDALAADEVVDVITFNDVLEHLRDPAAAVASSFAHLSPGGLLSINIPNSRGLAFGLARLAARLGFGGAYERLWQKGLPSPHLWYLSSESLGDLGTQLGFRVVSSASLPSLARAGLWERLHMDRTPSLSTRLQFVVLVVLRPVLNSSAFSDILHIVLVKPRNPTPADSP